MSLRTPTQGPRIVPFGTSRQRTDVLPNGHVGFRVTQRFADVDRFFGGTHGALDLGNFTCGDLLLASVGGTIRNLRDIYGALIVEVVERSGAISGYGHVSTYLRPNGATVAAGNAIARVGDTGLGNVCHCHYYRRQPTAVGGALVDPWPLLEQNVKPSPQAHVKFNADVDGVNIRTAPDARPNNVYAVAFKDPKGIVRDGKRIGSTSSRRDLKATRKGPDGQTYYQINLGGGTWVNTAFMHRV